MLVHWICSSSQQLSLGGDFSCHLIFRFAEEEMRYVQQEPLDRVLYTLLAHRCPLMLSALERALLYGRPEAESSQ